MHFDLKNGYNYSNMKYMIIVFNTVRQFRLFKKPFQGGKDEFKGSIENAVERFCFIRRKLLLQDNKRKKDL